MPVGLINFSRCLNLKAVIEKRSASETGRGKILQCFTDNWDRDLNILNHFSHKFNQKVAGSIYLQ